MEESDKHSLKLTEDSEQMLETFVGCLVRSTFKREACKMSRGDMQGALIATIRSFPLPSDVQARLIDEALKLGYKKYPGDLALTVNIENYLNVHDNKKVVLDKQKK